MLLPHNIYWIQILKDLQIIMCKVYAKISDFGLSKDSIQATYVIFRIQGGWDGLHQKPIKFDALKASNSMDLANA